MSVEGHPELPDPDVARQVIREAVAEFGPRIARQARAHAEAVRPFLEGRRLRRSRAEAVRLISDIADRPAWVGTVSNVLEGFFPVGDSDGWDPGGLHEALWPVGKIMDQTGPGLSWLYETSDRELMPVLRELHQGLLTVADRLAASGPRPPLLPAMHPPGFARLREHLVAETVADELDTLVQAAVRQYETAGEAGRPGPTREPVLNEHVKASLSSFLTTEVSERYQTATCGFEHLQRLAAGSNGYFRSPGAYEEISRGIHPRVHSAFAAITATYLAEVLDLMPDYAEASGQGRRRDPVTVYGNVGAINSQVNNSHVSVADTVTGIGATVEVVAGRGHTDAAAALRALTDAIQHDREIAEDLRAQLLDHVADVADAAAEPDQPRRLSRARAAMTAITAASGASSQLAQAVGTWQGVLGQLF